MRFTGVALTVMAALYDAAMGIASFYHGVIWAGVLFVVFAFGWLYVANQLHKEKP